MTMSLLLGSRKDFDAGFKIANLTPGIARAARTLAGQKCSEKLSIMRRNSTPKNQQNTPVVVFGDGIHAGRSCSGLAEQLDC